MTGLIKITTKGDQQLVSARELHKFLDVMSDFPHWSKRMFEYGFEQGVDYSLVKNDLPNDQGFTNPNPKIDYALTLDCAKEIAMIQRTDKGKQARQYFIECEKQLRGFSIPLDYKQAVKALLQQIEINEKVEERLLEVQPKVDFYDKVAESSEAVSMDKAAQLLRTGRNKLFEILREKTIMKPKSTLPYQRYVDAGYFIVTEKPYPDKKTGETRISITTQVTQKGIQYINKHILA